MIDNQLPSLTQIKLKGDSSLEGIQFLFNNGIRGTALESPFISSCENFSSQSTEHESAISTYDLDRTKQISSVKLKVKGLVEITGFEMTYADGSVAVSHTFDSRGVVFKQEIP